uniref:Putative ste20-like kinase b n=1 Tax=Ixodes ricinus TaxID=34613 RepID=A0A0K8RBK5_IXORI
MHSVHNTTIKKKAEHLNNKKKSTNLSNIVTGTAAILSHTALITGTITSNKSALFNNVHTSPAAVEAPQVCLMLDNQALLPLFYVSNVVHRPKRTKASRMRFTELQTGKGSVFKFDRTCS